MRRTFTVGGRRVELDADRVEEALRGILPEPVRDHYVVVGRRRFPPKQVIVAATGLDRADFTTHQARRILMRLGFAAGRRSEDRPQERRLDARAPHGGRQADALRPYVGLWVALGGSLEVLVAAETPEEVVSWLARHGRRAAGGMFRVPSAPWEAEGTAPA